MLSQPQALHNRTSPNYRSTRQLVTEISLETQHWLFPCSHLCPCFPGCLWLNKGLMQSITSDCIKDKLNISITICNPQCGAKLIRTYSATLSQWDDQSCQVLCDFRLQTKSATFSYSLEGCIKTLRSMKKISQLEYGD